MVLLSQATDFGEIIHLPQVHVTGGMSLIESIAKRRSVREFASKSLAIEQIGQLLWAVYGLTESREGLRASPSAGALYPMELYIVAAAGIYHYNPHAHELKRVLASDKRLELQKAAMDQEAIGSAPVVFVFAAVYERTAVKYDDRASRYVPMEAGHACQNLLLLAAAMNLSAVPMGAFYDRRVSEVLNLAKQEQPLYLVPVGYPA
ncbi:MAG: SagB/ThcOx family dehydrogenase [Gammaproteobacteria bacterium]